MSPALRYMSTAAYIWPKSDALVLVIFRTSVIMTPRRTVAATSSGVFLTMSNIDERVKKIVCEQLGVKEEEVTTESSFVNDLGADSLDTVELVMALEEEFETEIPDEEAEKITTVKEAIDYILAHQ